MNPFSPDCCHMAGLVCPGHAGLNLTLLPGARGVKIQSQYNRAFIDRSFYK